MPSIEIGLDVPFDRQRACIEPQRAPSIAALMTLPLASAIA